MPGQSDSTVIHAGSPLAHTLAIADAARVYVDFALSPHWEQGEHTKKLGALIAAVDAEKAVLCTSPSCGDRPHSAHPSWSELVQAAGGLDDEGTTGIDPRGIR